MNLLRIFILLLLVSLVQPELYSQSGLCDPITPFYSVDLTGNPSGTWVSAPPVQRAGNCCGTSPPDKCVEFSITLDPSAVAINFDIASGAIPPGALYYQIGCGPQVQVGQPICLNGPGPYTLTFCKPGNNLNTYAITSIAGPSVSPSDTTAQGCSAILFSRGLIETGITWTSIYPGAPGAYDYFLTCTSGCDTTYASPQNIYPPFVDYVVCGYPNSGPCAPPGQFCDTVRIFFNAPLSNIITPNPAHYCENDSGIQLQGIINGGVPPYQYFWTNGANGSGSFIANTVDYFASVPGTYSLTVRDSKYPGCPQQVNNVTVIKDFLPVANAGPNQTICATNLATALNASIANANSAMWTGGNGTFNPNNAALNAIYTPSPAEVAAGSVTLTLTTVTNTTCPEATDAMTITIAQPLQVTINAPALVCYQQNATLSATVTGGTAPYSYLWSTGETTASIANKPAGTYSVTVTDASNNACVQTTSFTIAQNPQLSVTLTPDALVSCNTSVTIIATPQGGTGTYNYLWNNGSTLSTVVVPTGTYTVTVTDGAGCTANNTVSVSAVPTLLTATINQPSTLCNGTFAPITVVPSGGYGNYSYLWNTGETTNTVNHGAGSYCATVTDGGGCTTTYCINLTQNSILTAIANTPPMVCYGGTATVTVTAGGGQPPYTYLWNTGDVTPGITEPAGTYTVTITDANQNTCTAYDIAVITESPQIILVPSWTDVNCNGGNDGTATVNVIGGVQPYYYVWSPTGQATATATGLLPGAYSITVTDSIGCANNASVTISNPPVLTAAIISSQNISCNGAANGIATVVGSGGTGNYTYSWSTNPVQTTSTAINLPVGTFTATITDENQCSATATVTITEPSGMIVTSFVSSPITCNGGTATITINAVGGAPPYTGTGSYTLQAGTYTFTVFDTNNCSATTTITVVQPNILNATITSVTDVSCNGGANGSATVTVTGGTGSYLYNWNTSPVQSSSTATNLSVGSYTVSVTDANGCTTVTSTSITQPAAIVASSSIATPVLCNGGNATIIINANGGQLPYTGTGQFSVVAGTYTYTVTDASGCSAFTSITVTQPQPLTASYTINTGVACNGGTANVTIAAQGGTAPYSGNGTFNIAAGTYTYTVTDANGCTATTSFTIAQPTALAASLVASANVSCFGGNNGYATVLVNGGTGNYTYSWNTNPVQTTATANNLSAGNYTVIITDGSGCTLNYPVNVTQPQALTASASVSTPVICNTGAVTVTATGGTPPYTGTGTFTVTPGTYTYTVTDANNCSATTTIVVSGPNTISAAATVTTAIACNGSSGIVTVTASGGTQPYTGTGNFNVTAGTYSYTVTDANGCSSTTSITVTQPTALVASIASSTNVNCYGGNTGSALVNVVGGVGPYTYSWNTSPIQTTAAALNLQAGSYFVTVTDANSCTSNAIATITQPPVLVPSAIISTPIDCYGNTGVINVTAIGGIAPYNGTGTFNVFAGTYTYNISDANGCLASTSALIVTQPTALTATAVLTTPVACSGNGGVVTVSAAGGTAPYNGVGTFSASTGTYTYTVTDANNCTATATITVTQPNVLIASIANTTNVSCFNGSDGNATVSVTGGTPNYTYTWNTTPAQSGPTALNLSAGTYIVSIADANNCNTSQTITITQPAQQLTATAVITTPVNCNGGTATVSVTATGGIPPYTGTGTFSVIAGTYTYTVTDANNCAASTATITVTQPMGMSSSIASYTDVLCNGASTGTATVQVTGGQQPYNYQWQPLGGNAQQAINLPAGTFNVIITDDNGCNDTATVIISQPQAIQVTAAIVPATCGNNNGSANVTVTGGTPFYTYNWSNGSQNQGINNVFGGNYSLSVQDANGCSTTSNVTVGIIGNPITITHNLINVACTGQNNGSVTLNVTGGGQPFSYQWSNGSVSPNLSGLSPGIYYVTVTNVDGCTDSDTVTITEPAPLNVLSTINNVTCYGYNNGQIALNPIGGTGPYTYQWTPAVSNSAIAGSLQPGNYSVTVTDSRGCAQILTFNITQPQPLTNTVTGVNVSCNGYNDGSAMVNVIGGTMPYFYTWTPAVSSGSSAFNLTAGTYVVSIVDNNGCITNSGVVITQPPPINVSTFGGGDTICVGQSTLISISASGGSGNFTYMWNQGIGSGNAHLVSPTTTTIYTGYAIDQTGCVGNSQPVVVYVNPPLNVNILANVTTVCVGDSVRLIAVASGGDGAYTYTWDPMIGLGPGPFVVELNTNTVYTVTVTDGCGSTAATSSISINVVPPFIIAVTPAPAQGCAPLTVTFNTTITPLEPGITYTWNFGDGTGSNYMSPTHVFTNPGSYIVSVEAVSPTGCTVVYTLPSPVDVYPSAIADFYPQPDTVLMLMEEMTFVNNSGNSSHWLWTFGDGTTDTEFQPSHYFVNYGNFNVMLIADNDFGCPDTAYYNVVVRPEFTFYVPNAFTPNENLVNETFKGYGTCISEYAMYLFDRWGNKMYESFDINNGWDGRANGSSEIALDDVYVYMFVIKDCLSNKHTYRGIFTLIK